MEAPKLKVACFVLVGLLGITGIALSDDAPSLAPTVPQTQVCLDCHEDQGASLALTPHRVSDDAWLVACTSCHLGDPRHWEEDPEEWPMSNPANLPARAIGATCSSCHFTPHQQNMMEGNAHTDADVGCMSCHGIHGVQRVGLLKQSQPELCYSCHAGVQGQFALPSRHPVQDGVMDCTQCHQTLDNTQVELSRNGTNICADCHAEFAGPFPFEHHATLDYSTEEGACLACHSPHGSTMPRLMNQPYAPPHFQTCSQCHSVPLHNQNIQHGTAWAGVDCNECHSDIHGSYTSRYFLSESLEGQGCFNSGCHQF